MLYSVHTLLHAINAIHIYANFWIFIYCLHIFWNCIINSMTKRWNHSKTQKWTQQKSDVRKRHRERYTRTYMQTRTHTITHQRHTHTNARERAGSYTPLAHGHDMLIERNACANMTHTNAQVYSSRDWKTHTKFRIHKTTQANGNKQWCHVLGASSSSSSSSFFSPPFNFCLLIHTLAIGHSNNYME